MVVLDASVVVDYLLGDPSVVDTVRTRLTGDETGGAAPHLLDVEVAHALRNLVFRQQVSLDRAELALVDLASMAVARISHIPLLPRIWELRDNLSAHDATYVALAEALECRLLTRDDHLGNTPGMARRVEVI